MVQSVTTVCAKSMATVHQNTRNALSNIILETTELADIKLARLIVQIHDSVHRPIFGKGSVRTIVIESNQLINIKIINLR